MSGKLFASPESVWRRVKGICQWGRSLQFNVRAKLLVPLMLLIIALFTTCGLVMYVNTGDEIIEESDQAFAHADESLQFVIASEVDKMQAVLEVVCRDDRIKAAFVSGDTASLLAQARPIFERFHRDHRISHFYFYDLQRVCRLRVHQPDRFGDTIDRFTAIKAQKTGRVAWGLELGPLGTFTLRVVRPWHDDKRLIGYVELGENIGGLIERLKRSQGMDFIVGVDRQYLAPSAWTKKRKAGGLEAQRQVVGSTVIVARTDDDLPGAILGYLDPARRDHRRFGRTMTVAGKVYRMASRSLSDAGGRQIGCLLMIRNASGEIASLHSMLAMLALVFGGVGLAVIGLAWLLLNRVDRWLQKQATTLQNSEIRHRMLYESSRDALMILDEKGFLDCNPATLEMFGCASRDEFCGKHPADFSPPRQPGGEESMALAGQRIAHAMREGRCFFEWEHCRIDGSVFPAEVLFSRMMLNGRTVLQAMVRDITARKNTEQALHASEQRLRTILQASKDAMIVINDRGLITLFNPAAEQLFGYTKQQMLGRDLTPILPESVRAEHAHKVAGFFKHGQPNAAIGQTVELTAMTADGREVPVELLLSAGKCGEERFVLAVIRDITERLEAQKEIEKSQERFQLVVRGTTEGIWDWDMRTGRIYYSPQWKQQLGWADEEIGDRIEEWLQRIVSNQLQRFNEALESVLSGQTDQFDVELMMAHRDGGTRWMLSRGVAVRDEQGNVIRLAGALADITSVKQAQQELQRLARQDPLTGLANRNVFSDAVQRAIDRFARHPDQTFAVLFFDFDRFKLVNDSMGHAAGDALLRSIADIFRDHARATDCVARFGGDEFAMLLDDVADLAGARRCAHRLLDAFRQPHRLGDHEMTSTASIGIAYCDPSYRNADDMLRDADAALYVAKQAGRDRIRVFNEELRQTIRNRVDLERDLRRAMADGQLELYYQPIVHLESGDLAGFEALLRWNHPTRGLVAPDQFIPIAEETGLIVPIGRWVLRQACEQLDRWQRQCDDHRRLMMAVNVSRRQLIHPEFCQDVSDGLAAAAIRPDQLHLEITETLIVDQRYNIRERMDELRLLGVQLAMDDFGTGYSSLSCLNRFPIQELKIDRAFIVNMTEHVEFAAVVHAIVTLAQHLGLKIVAEGLETAEQVAQLQTLNCDYGQGYYFARPMPADQAEQFIASCGRMQQADVVA